MLEILDDRTDFVHIKFNVASEGGDMRPVSPSDIQDRAEFLVGALWGGRMTVRLHGDVTVAGGVARTVIATVKSWRTDQ